MTSILYAIAAIALVVFCGPAFIATARQSLASWRKAGGAVWGWLANIAGYSHSKNVTLVLLGIAIAFGGMAAVKWGPQLVNIDWPTVTPDVPVVEPAKPTAVVYVYEKDEGGIPSGVLVALDKLNRQGIVATTFEDDTTDGTGDVPAQYAVAKAEATKAGLPALVVQAGDKVLRVVKSPASQKEVMEAIAL